MAEGKKKEKLGTYAMDRVAAGAHFPTLWLLEPTKRPDDSRLLLGLQFLPLERSPVTRFTVEWIGARHMGEQ